MANIWIIFRGILGIVSVAGLSIYNKKKTVDAMKSEFTEPEITIYRNDKT